MSETGTATLGINVARKFRRKKNTTRMTSPTEMNKCAFHVLDRRADRCRAVEHDGEIDRGGNRSLQRRKFRIDAVHRINDVRTGLPGNDEQNGRFPVHEASGANVFDRILDVGDIRKFDGRAIVIADDERLVVFGLQQLVVRGDVSGGLTVGNLPFREIRVLGAQHFAYVLHAEAVTIQLRGIQFHANGRKRASADGYLSHALNLRELLLT